MNPKSRGGHGTVCISRALHAESEIRGLFHATTDEFFILKGHLDGKLAGWGTETAVEIHLECTYFRDNRERSRSETSEGIYSFSSD